MPTAHNFQVDLAGLIHLLSDHLYSSDQVFVRELLQNAMDAISARRVLEPDFIPLIRFTFFPDRATLRVQDNGIGLTADEVTQFLSSIGSSSKRGLADQRAEFIGQFGIGLLSCFMVSDSIHLITQSAKGGPALEWVGRDDGTFTTEERPSLDEPGTRVEIQLRPEKQDRFDGQRIIDLLQHYGELLAYPVEAVTYEDGAEVVVTINTPFLLVEDLPRAIAADRQGYLAYGKQLFGFSPIDVIPLQTPSGGTKGLAFIFPTESHPRNRPPHRIYLKRMLLSDKLDDLLPEWAFFVQAIVNTEELQPTASRENFYENEALERVRKLLGKNIRAYLIQLHQGDPKVRDEVLMVHENAIKKMAEHDEELYRIMIPHLTFPTTQGRMSIRDYRQQASNIRHIYDLDEYRKITPLAQQAGETVILSRYENDRALLQKLPQLYEGMKIEQVSSREFLDQLDQISFQEQARWAEFLAFANELLADFNCQVYLKRFAPSNLPTMLDIGRRALIQRGLEKPEEQPETPAVWSTLASALGSTTSDSQLSLNLDNELVQQLLSIKQEEDKKLFVHFLYLQALLMGRYTLTKQELGLLNDGLMQMIFHVNRP